MSQTYSVTVELANNVSLKSLVGIPECVSLSFPSSTGLFGRTKVTLSGEEKAVKTAIDQVSKSLCTDENNNSLNEDCATKQDSPGQEDHDYLTKGNGASAKVKKKPNIQPIRLEDVCPEVSREKFVLVDNAPILKFPEVPPNSTGGCKKLYEACEELVINATLYGKEFVRKHLAVNDSSEMTNTFRLLVYTACQNKTVKNWIQTTATRERGKVLKRKQD